MRIWGTIRPRCPTWRYISTEGSEPDVVRMKVGRSSSLRGQRLHAGEGETLPVSAPHRGQCQGASQCTLLRLLVTLRHGRKKVQGTGKGFEGFSAARSKRGIVARRCFLLCLRV